MRKINICFFVLLTIIATENIAQADNSLRFIVSNTTNAFEGAIKYSGSISKAANYVLKGNEVLKAVGNGLQILEAGVVKWTLNIADGSSVILLTPVTEGGLLLQAISEKDVACVIYQIGLIGLYFYSIPLYTIATYLDKLPIAVNLYKTIIDKKQKLENHLSTFPKEAKCTLF